MDLSTSADDPTCLTHLEKLLAKVKHTVQTRMQSNQLSQYRCDFQITQPKYLVNGVLQQHQMEALEWMVDLASQESNGILADDMGLGKTIQAISYMAYLKEEHGILGKHLVLCPKSVCNNWIRQVKKWFPSANVQLLLNTQKEREQTLQNIVKPRKFDILVTTYEGAKTSFSSLSRIKWEVMVVDEAHKIKNSESQNFKILSCYRASFKLLLTGTPLSNNLRQLWSLLNFIMPDIFDNCYLFDDIENSVDQFVGNEEQKLAYQCKVANFFHQIIEPFFKRRAKKDLELGLPPKIQKTIFVPLTELQLKLYRNFLKYGNVLGPGEHSNYNIMNPRKICLHPYLFEGVEEEDVDTFGEHLVQSCGKLKVMDKLLHKLIGEGHKVLIFSQFTMLLDLLEDYCMLRGYKFCRIDGNTDIDSREKQMDQFNNTNNFSIFLLSTRAGGLGVNLVSADRVIIYDIDWNPQNDLQAMDRAYRIGQTKAVHVYKLVTEHSIEERILQLQKYKLIWDELVIQKGAFMGRKRSTENPFSNFSSNQLALLGKGDIFRLQANEQDKTIQEILAIGDLKDKKQSQEIRKKMVQNFESRGVVINPFQHMNEEQICKEYDQFNADVVIRRNYDHQKREKAKFERNYNLPAFKFYLQSQKIRQLQFQLYMESKRQGPDPKIIQSISMEIKEVKAKGKFDNWRQEEFNLFLQAHKTAMKNNYQRISQLIGSKTWEEVRQYSRHYFQKAPNNQRLRSSLNLVQQYQARLRKQMKEKGLQVKQTQEVEKILIQKQPRGTDSSEQEKNIHSDNNSEYSSKTLTKQQDQLRKENKKVKKTKAQQRQEEIKKKQQAKMKRQEQLKAKEQLKKQREQERLKKAEERKNLIQQKKKQKQIRQEGWRIKREQRQEEQKIRKEKKEQQQAKKIQKEEAQRLEKQKQRQAKAQKEEAERLQKQRERQTLEQIKREFEIKKAEIEKDRLKHQQQMLIKQTVKEVVKRRSSQLSNQTSKLRGGGDVANIDDRQTKPKLEIVKARGKDMRFSD